MELIYGDLSAASSSLEIELYDRILLELMGRQTNVVFSGSFAVTYTNSSTLAVAIGNGVYYDSTQVDPEPLHRLLFLSSAGAPTVTTPDGTHNRIDLVCITPGRSVIGTATRNYKDPNSGLVSSQSENVENDWLSTLSVVAGTPSSSPAVPSTPAGAIALAQVLVTAVTGIANQAAITDVRPRYRRNAATVQTVTTTYAIDLDDSEIYGNAAGGGFTVTMPKASL